MARLKSAPEAPLSHATLKQRHRLIRASHPASLTLRIHRALSWLNRSEQCDDIDGRFIFLWIAFNAAYAHEIDDGERMSDKTAFVAFLKKICELDRDRRIGALIWNEFSGSIRVLLENPFVFPAFWDHQRGRIAQSEWKERFASAKRAAQTALASGDTANLLAIVFARLYTLRNQIFHGGATWGGKVNREQLRDCTNLLAKLVPLIIALMMDNPTTLWGDAVYPVVEQSD